MGAGVFGLSVARELAGRGWTVQLVDTEGPGVRGPSSAHTRILRYSHGSDEFYPALARRAAAGWAELERETDRRLVLPVGVLIFSDVDQWLRDSVAALRRMNIPLEMWSGREASARFPGFAADGGCALFEPDGAVLLARDAVLALARSAMDRGVEVVRATARPVAGRAVVAGRVAPADRTVWTVGPDFPTVFPGIAPVRRVRQDSWYVAECGPWAAQGTVPAWLDRGPGYYGVPSVVGQGVKVVPDVETPLDAPTRLPAGGLPADVRAYLRARLPDLADAPVLGREPRQYALTCDEHFLLVRHPADDTVWLVSGDSGHGFKHGPAWGEYVCDVIEGRRTVDRRFTHRCGQESAA